MQGRRQQARLAREHRRKKVIAVLLLCAGMFGVVCFTALMTKYLVTRRQGEAYYASLPSLLQVRVPAYAEEPAVTDDMIEILTYTPDFRTMPLIDFEPLREQMPDIEAWIRIEGTMLDYPVMQGDNNDFYLNHLPNGQKSDTGSIFIDFRNIPDFWDENTLLHGHRMKSGAMFGTLREYAKQSFYDKHPVVSIFTPGENLEVQLFAGYVIDQNKEAPPFKFENDEHFLNYIEDIRRRSFFKSKVEVTSGDRLVTFSTCEYTQKDGRLVLVGKLVER